jgi:hypothetical protein
MNKSLADALAPVANQLRLREALVQPVSQVLLRVRKQDGISVFDETRNAVLRWLDNRAGSRLPNNAWEGDSFELEEVGAQRTAAVTVSDPHYWAARLDDADRYVPQRVWTTEIGIGEHARGTVLVGARLFCSTRGDLVPFNRSVPGFIRQIVEGQPAELDGHSISTRPRVIATEEDVDDLVGLLISPVRTCDVIVFSLPERSTDPLETAASASEVALRTIGGAHVTILTGPASYMLTDRVGKEFSVFHQGVRTYRPGFNPNQDEPFSHPLALPSRIAAWPDDGARAYERFLVAQALARTVSRSDIENKLPSFAAVRRVAAQIRISAAQDGGSSTSDLLKLAEEENERLRKALDEEKDTSDGLLKVAEDERSRMEAEADQLRANNRHLRCRIQQLEEQSRSNGGTYSDIDVPSTLGNFEDWCTRHLAGSVEMHNRAFQGIKRSEFAQVPLIYKSLLMLRDYYVPMRRNGGLERLQAFEQACETLGITEEPTFTGPRLGEEGETYLVRFSGRLVELDRHLKKGISREPRFCLRVYFFWDAKGEQVVVGWLPSHLDTRIT